MPRAVPVGAQDSARACALRSAYALVEPPSAWTATESLVKALDQALSKEGLGLRAWRAAPAGADDPFARDIRPSGLLFVSLTNPAVSVDASTSPAVYKAVLSAAARLQAYPSGEVLAELRRQETLSEQAKEGSDAEDWFRAAQGRALAALGKGLAERLVPRSRHPVRRIFRRKGEKASEAAFSAARAGRWAEAEAAWEKEAERSAGWRDLSNLAAAAEARGDRARARGLYEKARLAAGADPEAAKVPWAEIGADLDEETPCAEPRPSAWFSRRLAVLPFSDETNSVEGPELARRLVHKSLSASGLKVVSVEETDAVLRANGVSQGGQLPAVKPQEIARWLKADLLLYADIDEYNEIPLGVYNRRSVSGTLRLLDASGKVLWEGREAAVRQSAGGKFVQRLVGQLVKGWAERLAKSPLKEEAEAFARAAAARVPRKLR